MQTEPDMRPLGALALCVGLLSAVFSMTYFLSPLAYLAAVIALPLGLLSRSHERSRGFGNAALTSAVVAVVVASATLIWV